MAADGLSISKGVILKGLPFSVTEDEIKQFFKPIDLPSENIRIIRFRDGKKTGLGFVLLKEEEVQHALLMDKNHIGKRYIEVTASDETELHHLLLKARSGEVDAREINRIAGQENKKNDVGMGSSPIYKKLPTRFAYIQGIPPGNQYKEVRRFLQGCLIGRNCIHLLKMENSGDFRGDGYIEFGNSTECRKGLKLDGQTMDGAVIRLEPCTQEEVQDVMGWISSSETPLETAGRSSFRRSRRDRTPSPVRRRMMVYAATYGGREQEEPGYFTPAYQEREDRYRDTIANMAYGGASYFSNPPPEKEPIGRRRSEFADEKRSYRDRSPPLSRRSWPSEETSYRSQRGREIRDSPVGFHSISTATSGYGGSPSISKSASFMDYLPLSGGDHSDHSDVKFHSMYSSNGSSPATVHTHTHGHGAHSSSLSMSQQRHQLPPTGGSQGVERKVVRMEGLPYDVTIQDIVDFFRGYGVGYENVRIQCRDDGSPSGKAFVTFPTEKLAFGASEELNKKYIKGRYVEMFLV